MASISNNRHNIIKYSRYDKSKDRVYEFMKITYMPLSALAAYDWNSLALEILIVS